MTASLFLQNAALLDVRPFSFTSLLDRYRCQILEI